MTARVVILGLPGSGTSAVAEAYFRAGYSDCPPTFRRGEYAYDPHESLLGRAVNRIIIGVPEVWPSYRWNHDFRARNPYNDHEVKAMADWFVSENDRNHGRWFFKNPETMLNWSSIWRHYEWDEVVGVYRHPDESVKTLHSEQGRFNKRSVWNSYAKFLIRVSTRLVRFPDGVGDLANELRVESPIVPGIRRTCASNDPAGTDWCARWWKKLEARREGVTA